MVYVVHAVGTNRYKIGYSKSGVEGRLKSLQTGCPFELKLISVMEGDLEFEQQLHESYAGHRIQGEWFLFSNKLVFDLFGYKQDCNISCVETTKIQQINGEFDKLLKQKERVLKEIHMLENSKDVLARSSISGDYVLFLFKNHNRQYYHLLKGIACILSSYKNEVLLDEVWDKFLGSKAFYIAKKCVTEEILNLSFFKFLLQSSPLCFIRDDEFFMRGSGVIEVNNLTESPL